MKNSHHTSSESKQTQFVWVSKTVGVDFASDYSAQTILPTANHCPQRMTFDPLKPVRQRLDGLKINDPKLAKLICQTIPARCPFERTITLFNRTLLRIPPLCKLNPIYEELVAIRFRALCYLTDECGEDVSHYC